MDGNAKICCSNCPKTLFFVNKKRSGLKFYKNYRIKSRDLYKIRSKMIYYPISLDSSIPLANRLFYKACKNKKNNSITINTIKNHNSPDHATISTSNNSTNQTCLESSSISALRETSSLRSYSKTNNSIITPSNSRLADKKWLKIYEWINQSLLFIFYDEEIWVDAFIITNWSKKDMIE